MPIFLFLYIANCDVFGNPMPIDGMEFAIPCRIFRQPKCARDRRRYKTARMRSHVPSPRMIALSSTSLYCFSVQQGPVRDGGVQIPRQARRLRLGCHPGHPHPLLQAAEADLRRLRQLRPKVGSATIFPVWCWFFLLGKPSSRSTFDVACVSHEHGRIHFVNRRNQRNLIRLYLGRT